MKNLQNENDRKVEKFLGNFLRAGVLLAALIVLIGCVLYLINHGLELPNYSVFKGEPKIIESLGSILQGISKLNSIAIIQFGVLILIATPVLRVLFSVFAFIYEKDLMYVVFTLIVLVVLLISIFG